MTKRSDALQHFISSLQIAVLEGDLPDAAKPAATRIFDALAAEEGKQEPPTAKRLPVCDHLPTTFENAKAGPDRTIQLGAALSAIEPQLAWFQKPAGDEHFRANHANTVVIGVDGIERRNDVRIGVSLVAPDTVYPDHNHPPEEIYAVLSDGAWRQNKGAWRKPGLGGTVHNVPNILHGMRSYDTPLLAVWSLWVGG
ncbi:MAG: transcriptional regulator [Rhodospirillaceae bacterium]|jgi:hypothetical protein|nr:transcriptional regulator [Rhodospirillaceae bacterium]